MIKKSAIMIIDLRQGSKWLAQHVFKQVTPIDFKTLMARNQALIAHASDAGMCDYGDDAAPFIISSGTTMVFTINFNHYDF